MHYSNEDIFFEYEVKYSNRKSIEIRIEPTGIVVFKVPKKTSDQVIQDVLTKKRDWIFEKVTYMLSTALPKRQYETGEKVLYLNQKLTLKVIRRPSSKMKISKVDQELVIVAPEQCKGEELKQLIIDLYKNHLKSYLISRIKFYQNQFKYKVNQVTVRDQKTRWGSCSSGRNLSFNYRLMMAPPQVIDYIVVHEMCHLEHMNHSKSYWKRVYEVMPEYKKCEAWLKQNGRFLNIDLEVE